MRLLLWAVFFLADFCLKAQEAGTPRLPEHRELWIPADKLNEVLKNNPKAIVLSREQYETLLRDATRETKKAPEPPRRAALSSAKYSARAEGKTLRITGELIIEVLSDEWTTVPLPARGVLFGSIQIDGEAALYGSTVETSALFVRGRGQHNLTAEFTAPISNQEGQNSFEFGLPPAAANLFEVELPARVQVDSQQPARIEKRPESTRLFLAPAPSAAAVGLKWRTLASAVDAKPVLTQKMEVVYEIDAEKLRADFWLTLFASLGNIPAELLITIPKGAQVLQMDGAEAAKWSVANDRIRIEMPLGDHAFAQFRIVIETPSLAGAPAATLTLPVLKIDGVQRMAGVFSINADLAGVAIRDIATDVTITQIASGEPDAPGLFGRFAFNGASSAPRLSLVKVESLFNADLDTRIEFKPEAIFLERTMTLRETQGALFSASFKLPAGEELLSVRSADGVEPVWRMENGAVRLRWGDRSSKPRVFKIATRFEPKEWASLGFDGINFSLGDLQIEGAGKVTGYIALKADPAFRLEAQPSETLELRDGRTTPVRGDYAWFRRKDFSLNVKVSRLPGEALAVLTGYALPLEGTLDVHARMAFTFLHSGVRSVRIQVPERIAASFHFEGPQIAERNLVGDIWTIVFQKELTGEYPLDITVQAPIPKDASDTFQTEVPLIEPLDVKRVSGVWAVEANTETEISFMVKGMNELDSLLAPALPDYQPRHRVIGVFSYLGSDHSLALAGVRHGQAAALSSIVDQFDLDTVVSTSGIERSQAIFQLRSAGAQFLDVTLPPGSKLWSLSVNDSLVKPVGSGKDGMVRIQLPAQLDPQAVSSVMLLYETPKLAWHSRGGYDAVAPRISETIPILKSRWQVFLPDGFQYTGFESNLRPPSALPEPLLVEQFVTAILPRAFRRANSNKMLSDERAINSGISDPRPIPGLDPPIPGLDPPNANPIPNSALDFSSPQTAAPMAAKTSTPSDSIVIKEFKVRPGFIGNPQTDPSEASVIIDAKEFLISQGITFPSGASASYRAGSRSLVVRNTQENLDLLEILMSPSGSTARLPSPAGVSGLLPIKMDLATEGHPVVFEGFYDAQTIAFHYEDWGARARRLWFWFIGGGVLFITIAARRHLWWRSAWAVLILSFVPLCISEMAAPVCNALLGGWLIGLVLHQIAVRFVFLPRQKEALA